MALSEAEELEYLQLKAKSAPRRAPTPTQEKAANKPGPIAGAGRPGYSAIASFPELAIRGLEAANNFIDKKIDRPTRRALGLPETGEEFANKIGVTDSTAPERKYPDWYQPHPIEQASSLSNKKAVADAYNMVVSPLNLLPTAIAKGSKAFSSKAEKFAEAATGATRVMAEKFKPGTGRVLLDEGVVSFGKSPAGISKAAKSGLNKSGDKIGDVLGDLVRKGAPQSDRQELALKMLDKADELKASNDQITRSTGEALESIAEKFAEAKQKSLSLTDVEMEKRALAKMGRFDRRNPAVPSTIQDANKEASAILRDHVERVATQIDPGLAEVFEKQKKLFGALAPVEKAATARAKQLNQHPIGGWNDMTAAVGGGTLGAAFSSGDPVTGLAAAAAGAIGRRVLAPRAASSMAATLNRMGHVLGMEYAKPLQKLIHGGTIPIARITAMAETEDGRNILKGILEDISQRSKSDPFEQLRRRNTGKK